MTGTLWWFRDSWEMVRRNLIHIKRTPELLLDVTLSPIMFVLLFNFVFGGAITVGVEGGEQADYINYMMSGIFVQTIAFAGIYTSVLLANDLQKGMIDRFRSLPMSQSSVLVGRTVTDLLRAMIAMAIVARRRSVTVRPTRTDDCDIGSDRKRSIMPFCRSLARSTDV